MFSLGEFVFKVIMKLYNNHDENFAFEHLIPWKGVGEGEREEGVGSNVSGCRYLPPNGVVSVSCT